MVVAAVVDAATDVVVTVQAVPLVVAEEEEVVVVVVATKPKETWEYAAESGVFELVNEAENNRGWVDLQISFSKSKWRKRVQRRLRGDGCLQVELETAKVQRRSIDNGSIPRSLEESLMVTPESCSSADRCPHLSRRSGWPRESEEAGLRTLGFKQVPCKSRIRPVARLEGAAPVQAEAVVRRRELAAMHAVVGDNTLREVWAESRFDLGTRPKLAPGAVVRAEVGTGCGFGFGSAQEVEAGVVEAWTVAKCSTPVEWTAVDGSLGLRRRGVSKCLRVKEKRKHTCEHEPDILQIQTALAFSVPLFGRSEHPVVSPHPAASPRSTPLWRGNGGSQQSSKCRDDFDRWCLGADGDWWAVGRWNEDGVGRGRKTERVVEARLHRKARVPPSGPPDRPSSAGHNPQSKRGLTAPVFTEENHCVSKKENVSK
ncbi:hypothetical protein CPB84DRAFT_1820578 [Gymnopilus junonius]|uniref:Uncharacterized protein n=1 Tax=Gymnopilus junonius TaxID=109634 RepID=A0A9P5NYT7_GYMJU|nr:hypothetical protein CPB84DRAFT_1820578 [Gymnopilus junonius]